MGAKGAATAAAKAVATDNKAADTGATTRADMVPEQ